MQQVYDNKPYKYTKMLKITLILYIITTLITLINTYVSHLFGGITIYTVYYLPVVIILLYILSDIIRRNNRNYINKKYLYYFLFFALVYFIDFQFIAENNKYEKIFMGINFNINAFQLINIVPVFLIAWYILQKKDKRFNQKLDYIIIISFVINAILTLKVLYTNPLAAKILATGEGGSEYLLKGASGFNVLYSSVLFVPCLFFLISEFKGIRKFLYISVLILILVYIYMCGYVTAILATILSISIYLFLNSNKIIKVFLVIPIIFIFTFIINRDIIYDFFIYFSNIINIDQISIRFHDIANMIKYGDTSADSLMRLDLYMNSIRAFKISPILGVFYIDPNYSLSGHSTILDILGGTGLFGFIPFIITIIYSYKNSIKNLEKKKYKNCIISCYVTFIFISLLNPQLASPNVLIILMIAIPIIPDINCDEVFI